MTFSYIGARSALTVVALLTIIACGDSKGSDNAIAAQAANDSAATRNLAMASADSAAKPQLQDVPIIDAKGTATGKAPAKRATTPTTPPPTSTPAATPVPTPASPTKGARTIAAGTLLTFASSGKVCSNTNQVGEKFTASLSGNVAGSNGASIPDGSTGTFEISSMRTAKNSADTTFLRVRLVSITIGGESYNVDATIDNAATERLRSATKGTDAKKVAGGAVIGAIIGQVIGKNTKGTVIGGAVGAAGGAAAASATADYDTCLNTGAAISVKLDTPLTVKGAK